MGVQSLDEELKKKVLNRRETNRQVQRSIELLKDAGILTICENMLGLPTQTEDDLIHMLRFYNQTRPNRLSLYFIRYYPRTKIIESALEEGILTRENVEEINQGLNARSFIQGGTIRKPNFARIQGFLTLIPVLPAWLNRFLINIRFYRVMPNLGMLTHSIARVLDRHKEFDVDAYQFKMRYKIFMLRKLGSMVKHLFSIPRASDKKAPAAKTLP
jgi:radical SAM superfamily enzyme YgiQ (UPF0313 family)